MTAVPDPRADAAHAGLELLERALAYTRGALAGVGPDALPRPTPCAGWTLADLLAHMEDALDAFTEGAGGAIALAPVATTPLATRLRAIHDKACGLLGAWTQAAEQGASYVDIGGYPVPVATVTRVASVEITVHGWDVGRATGLGPPIPPALAAALIPTAATLVSGAAGEFGQPVRVPAHTPADVRLLARLGRSVAGNPPGT